MAESWINKKDFQLLLGSLLILGLVATAALYCTAKRTDVHKSITIEGEGFLIRKVRKADDEECLSNKTVTSQGGILTSPGFPNRYPSNQDCRWLLTAPLASNSIVLIIKSLDLEKDRGCSSDYVHIFLGVSTISQSLARLCGTIRDKVIVTNSSSVLIVFHSDRNFQDIGFSLEYYLQSAEDCLATLTETSGSITSPGFPQNYPDDCDCRTLISVEKTQKIVLHFKSIYLEDEQNCTYDYVEVFDGMSKDAPSLGKFCSSNQRPPLHSTKNSLLIYFHSDRIFSNKGFDAQYYTIEDLDNEHIQYVGKCEWEKFETNGTIASPNYPQNYPSRAKCNILLIAPQSSLITIEFENLQLEIDTDCTYDFIEISDGNAHDSPKKRFCGKHDERRQFTSTGNVVFIKFESDSIVEFSGFKLLYKFYSPFKGNQTGNDSNKKEEETNDTHVPEKKDIFLVKPENATLEIGSSFMLQCAVSNVVATIQWKKDDSFLGGNTPLPGLKLMDNNTLWIHSMNEKLPGMYTCVAIAPEETFLASSEIKSKNDASPNSPICSIVLRKVPRDAYFTEGDFARMECSAAGHQVQIKWEKDGVPLQSTSRIKIYRNGVLLVGKTTMEDSGIYTCVVTNLVSECKKIVNARLTVNEKSKLQEICGKPKVGRPSNDKPHLVHGKIVGGHNTTKGAHPWQVMLWESHVGAFCGASLINERWIVTAAHCFIGGPQWNDIVIRLGKYDRDIWEPEEFITMIDERSAVLIHDDYNSRTFDNDIALVRLKYHVKFSDYILPICLGDKETYEGFTEENLLTIGTVTGWGQLTDKGGSPKFLQEIKMPIVDQKTCVDSTSKSIKVTSNMFCAGYAQEIIGDSCKGDSGGPLIVNRHGKWLLVGIVSWGEDGCGKKNKYGFYTKIMNYLPWIEGLTKS